MNTASNGSNAEIINEIARVLKRHFSLYPKMAPQDAVKLLYQSEFGCGHFAPSPERAREMLERECSGLEKDENHAKTEAIGGGFSRVHLEPLVGNRPALDALADAFVRSAELPCGSMESFEIRLDVLKTMAKGGETPFPEIELDAFLEEYEKLGCPAVHHSEIYRKSYHPAYRVIKTELAEGLTQPMK